MWEMSIVPDKKMNDNDSTISHNDEFQRRIPDSHTSNNESEGDEITQNDVR
jgi:hypothetical protein